MNRFSFQRNKKFEIKKKREKKRYANKIVCFIKSPTWYIVSFENKPAFSENFSMFDFDYTRKHSFYHMLS